MYVYRSVLEQKSRLYDKLSKEAENFSEEQIENNRHFLVRFDKKVLARNDLSDNVLDHCSDEEIYPQEYEPAKDADEEWYVYEK